MNSVFSKIWIVAILTILVAGGIFAWQYFIKGPKEEKALKETEVALKEEKEAVNGKTYRNEKYGIEIKYPSFLSFSTTPPQDYIVRNNWSGVSENKGEVIVSLPVCQLKSQPLEYHSFTAEFRIGANPDPKEVENCFNVHSLSLAKRVTIHDTEFMKFKIHDAALGHRADMEIYRTIYNNTCFSIEKLKYGVHYDELENPDSPHYSREYAQKYQSCSKMIDQILSTFRFIKEESLKKPQKQSCSEDDAGEDYYKKGITKGKPVPTLSLSNVPKTYTDYCLDPYTITEYYCQNYQGELRVNQIQTSCLYGCHNGACLKKEKQSLTVISPNGGENWNKDSFHEIKWESVGVERVDIILLDYRTGKSITQIATGISGFRSYYRWHISNNIPEGDYKILIQGRGIGEVTGKILSDESDNYFSIIEKKTGEEENAYTRDLRRKADIRIILAALEMFYSDNNQYLQSKTIPTSIGEYLDPVPKDPLGNSYHWLDNTPGALTGCNSQRYCVWAELEEGGYFVASEKGAKLIFTKPTKCPCW